MTETVKPKVLCHCFTTIVKNEPSVPHQLLSEVFALKLRLREKKDSDFINSGLIIEDNCIAVCDLAKQIDVTDTDTSFKIRRCRKDNKHTVWAFHLVNLDGPCPLLCKRASQHDLLEAYPMQLVTRCIICHEIIPNSKHLENCSFLNDIESVRNKVTHLYIILEKRGHILELFSCFWYLYFFNITTFIDCCCTCIQCMWNWNDSTIYSSFLINRTSNCSPFVRSKVKSNGRTK